MADEVRVDPAVLRTGARVCGELHAALTRDEAGIEGATTDAARGLEGWYTKRALEDLLWWLRDDSGRGRPAHPRRRRRRGGGGLVGLRPAPDE